MLVDRPVDRSSTMVTSQPRLRSCSARWLPMKPAPPVINAFCLLCFILRKNQFHPAASARGALHAMRHGLSSDPNVEVQLARRVRTIPTRARNVIPITYSSRDGSGTREKVASGSPRTMFSQLRNGMELYVSLVIDRPPRRRSGRY